MSVDTSVKQAFDSAGRLFEAPQLSFFPYFGRRSVEVLKVGPGESVLDVCCGTGSSAIVAAKAVGPTGSVTGVDLSEELLRIARTKTELDNIIFKQGDLMELEFEPSSFDCVICVFGIFFVEDMPAALRGLYRLLKPGGRLLLTTWKTTLEPGSSIFYKAVASSRPDLLPGDWSPRGFSEDGQQKLDSLIRNAGIDPMLVTTQEETYFHSISVASDWWAIVLGAGYRQLLAHLTDDEVEVVRLECLDRLANIKELECEVYYTIASKPM